MTSILTPINKLFHTIAWSKYLPPSANIYSTAYSEIILIAEMKNGWQSFSTLDRLAQVIKNRKGLVSAFGRYFRLQKQDAIEMAEDLNAQADKLIELANTYKIMATALTVSLDNIQEVISNDPLIKKEMENPF